jgi:hypothetical protein
MKTGDRVICVNAEASFNRLAVGAIYTVEHAHGEDGRDGIDIFGRTWIAERFIPMPEGYR